ncbi:LolA family protein [Lutimonas zeaxanthinifaciens]|uniref:LolA family protein n=1 Tax=Lutimonas zeaxanthinifaciens TaxID=3060215 RepID=UPI00265CEA1A|nr:outer membrane lipoprotein carrier protein LolA [Lutimonas sp. YSD2104]WKK66879.1 outer membrane lipoprotein carrier protein LolA [Lutimonas sp. YSD2104]
MMNRSRLNFKVMTSLFLGLIWMSSMSAQNDASAKSILDNASSTMSAYKNLSMDFDYVLDNRAEDVTQEMSGDVILQGEKYVVNLFGSTQMYDGVKTYTIIPENEEVNISEADIDEENTFTPSKFYSFYKSGYTYKMDELKKLGGKNIQFVRLTPIDSNSEIKSILVGIDTKTNHIYQIIEIGNNETRTILTAKNIKTNQEINGEVFVFNEKKYEDLNYMINK